MKKIAIKKSFFLLIKKKKKEAKFGFPFRVRMAMPFGRTLFWMAWERRIRAACERVGGGGWGDSWRVNEAIDEPQKDEGFPRPYKIPLARMKQFLTNGLIIILLNTPRNVFKKYPSFYKLPQISLL